MSSWNTLHAAVNAKSAVDHSVLHHSFAPTAQDVHHMGEAVNTTAGYETLRDNVDQIIAYLVAKKEKIDDAEATGDESMLKDEATMLSAMLQKHSELWADEVRFGLPGCLGVFLVPFC